MELLGSHQIVLVLVSYALRSRLRRNISWMTGCWWPGRYIWGLCVISCGVNLAMTSYWLDFLSIFLWLDFLSAAKIISEGILLSICWMLDTSIFILSRWGWMTSLFSCRISINLLALSHWDGFLSHWCGILTMSNWISETTLLSGILLLEESVSLLALRFLGCSVVLLC